MNHVVIIILRSGKLVYIKLTKTLKKHENVYILLVDRGAANMRA